MLEFVKYGGNVAFSVRGGKIIVENLHKEIAQSMRDVLFRSWLYFIKPPFAHYEDNTFMCLQYFAFFFVINSQTTHFYLPQFILYGNICLMILDQTEVLPLKRSARLVSITP